MSKVTVKINHRALRQLQRDVVKQLETNANAELQAVVREVRHELTGQPVDVVHSELDARLRRRIPGLEPNEQLREVAQAISDGELPD
jgi:hypothetical protein